jgi:SagB-type dehydrogenase family enzyme
MNNRRRIRKTISLPSPRQRGTTSLEEALAQRRSVRSFSGQTLTEQELSQLLWSLQGITNCEGCRTAPSAGALYPLEVHVATAAGLFHYRPRGHRLRQVGAGDLRQQMGRIALDQACVQEAAAVFVLAAVFERVARKYGSSDSPRYICMEVGHAAQNLLLQAVAMGLGAVPVGAFDEQQMQQILQLPTNHLPLYLVPVGHPR